MKLLLVEDHRDIAGIIFDFFEIKGHCIDYADNGELGLTLAKENHYDVIILDLMLPKVDGLAVCEQLRSEGVDTPVVMLTALDQKDDMLKGFTRGADDYVVKPFDLHVLEARISALYRRRVGDVSSQRLCFGDLSLNLSDQTASRAGQRIHLNQTQFTILKLLISREQHFVSRDELLETLWPDEVPDSDILRSHIYQLRNLIDKPFDEAYLKTFPKKGYALVSTAADESQN